MSISYPNESSQYRIARDHLTQAEVSLRAQVESVAALRRALPRGGEIPNDYVFTDIKGNPKPLSELFGGNKSLLVYSLMYRDDAQQPCPMCVSMLDGLDGQVPHIRQSASIAVVASAGVEKLSRLKDGRGWQHLDLYSAAGTTYQSDYHGETPDGAQLPMMNVFQRDGDHIRHFWGSESFFAVKEGQPRHVDMLWPLWNALDMTPLGRAEDWYPAISYD